MAKCYNERQIVSYGPYQYKSHGIYGIYYGNCLGDYRVSQRIRRLVEQLVRSVTPYRKYEKGRFALQSVNRCKEI